MFISEWGKATDRKKLWLFELLVPYSFISWLTLDAAADLWCPSAIYNVPMEFTSETILFNESIFNNIKYGNIEATDEEINLVAKNAGVNSFSEELDQKLHTVIGENGIKLSGGQRQRIAIARALIKDAPLLIMDEATSSLDNITENKIHETINSLMNNKTKLIIAHRLSTIEDADIIYVLDKGTIESQGSHEELISKSTIYKKLQLREQLQNEF